MLAKEELSGIQNVQLEIMDEVHRICVENNITYYMIGGTLLGAVRHKGFIPWDLDIDIAMPRKDYEHFKTICKKNLSTDFEYQDFTTSYVYTRPHALISKQNTLLKLKYDHLNKFNENMGIYIDIFPLDNAPDNEKARKKQAKRIQIIKRVKYFRIPYSYSKSKIKRKVHYAISFLLGFMPISKLNQCMEKQMRLYENERSKCICSMASGYSYWKQCMAREIYGQPELLTFEGRLYYAPAKYKEYLTRLYGDYMQIPPVESQRRNLEVYQSVRFATD